MTAEQRKIQLISDITALENESVLIRMQEILEASKEGVPDAIKRLLDLSNGTSETTSHKSVREFLK